MVRPSILAGVVVIGLAGWIAAAQSIGAPEPAGMPNFSRVFADIETASLTMPAAGIDRDRLRSKGFERLELSPFGQ